MKLTTAGESHGRALTAIIEGFPAGLTVDIGEIDRYLALRQSGYGRGGRQKIECDRVAVLSGIRDRVTLGSPICLAVKNKDYADWEAYMSPYGADTSARQLTKVRPGHADLAGMLKYGQSDARNVLERASARESAVRVAAGTLARQLLARLGVEVTGYVRQVENVSDDREYAFAEIVAAQRDSELFMPDKLLCEKAKKRIDSLKAQGDTAGGVIEVRVRGMKSGFGSCMTYGEKLDACLAFAAMSVQAVKGVEIGLGFRAAALPGSRVHDAVEWRDGRFARRTNRAGGIEGGMSNGEEIVLRAAMKPIPTLMQGLDTVDFASKESCRAASERSDVCAVCACCIILESAVCFALAQKVAERLGGDTVRDIEARWEKLPQ